MRSLMHYTKLIVILFMALVSFVVVSCTPAMLHDQEGAPLVIHRGSVTDIQVQPANYDRFDVAMTILVEPMAAFGIMDTRCEAIERGYYCDLGDVANRSPLVFVSLYRLDAGSFTCLLFYNRVRGDFSTQELRACQVYRSGGVSSRLVLVS